MNRRLGLASEEEVSELFNDCETGAVPPIGEALWRAVILDESSTGANDVYFEGGDHKDARAYERHPIFATSRGTRGSPGSATRRKPEPLLAAGPIGVHWADTVVDMAMQERFPRE